ncbi:MAG: DUF4363 family protein [Clostridia bacterium]|nr:DUF4363 family protein [Clostridia bacterium]
MKEYIIIGVAIAIILVLNFWQNSYLETTSRYILTDINEIENSVKREDFDSALKGAYELERTWDSVEFGWDIFGEHNDIESITEHIESIKVYAEYKDKEELVNEYTLLENLVNHVIEAEQVNFGNVL